MKSIRAMFAAFLVGVGLISCSGGIEDAYEDLTGDKSLYIAYHANGATNGSVPARVRCVPGDVVRIVAPSKSLYRVGYEFVEWNTSAEGGGISYPVGSDYTVKNSGELLYAQWRRWTSTWGDASSDSRHTGVAVDTEGNCFIVGNTTQAIGSAAQMGLRDLYLLKRRPNGEQEWVLQLGAAGQVTRGANLVLDADGNIYVVGESTGNMDGGGGPVTPGRYDIIVLKVSSQGAILWGPVQIPSNNFGSSPNHGIALDDAHCFIAGKRLHEDGGYGYESMIVAKLPRGAAGPVSPVWVKDLGFAGSIDDGFGGMADRTYAAGWAVAADGAGGCYVAGYVFGNLDSSGAAYNTFDPDGTNWSDALVVQVNAAGDASWIYRLPFAGQRSWLKGIAVASDGLVTVCGATNLPSGPTEIQNASVFLRVLDPLGGGDPVRWTYQSPPVDARLYVNALALDSDGSIYICGGTDVSLEGRPLVGSLDAFLMRFRRSAFSNLLGMNLLTTHGNTGKETWGDALAISGGSVYVVGVVQERGADGLEVENSSDAFATTVLSE